MSATAADLSEPNLVKMDTTTSMEEVNNNNNSFKENDAKQTTFANLDSSSVIAENNLVNEKLIQAENLTPTLVSSPGELNDGDTCSSIGGESSSSNNESTLSSIYSLNEALRLTVTYTEEWLCVARMPLDFTKAEFDKLLSEYGPVSQSFLIHSETSGTFKGYGLVKYVSKESSIQARHVLDGHEIREGHILNCDWLKQNNPGVTSLHSKCLFVDKLPESYRDMAEFRRLFSKVVNPPYCQVRAL